MNPLSILSFLKDIDPLTAVTLVIVLIIGLSQGWIVVKGIHLKKKSDKLEKISKPVICLRGRSGSCELIRLQMEQAEEIIQAIRGRAISVYMTKRKEILGTKEGLYRDRDIHHYTATLFQVEQRVKDDIRNFFRENHLAEMTEDEFNSHAQKRSSLIVTKITEYLDQLYYPESSPDRVALYDLNHTKLVPDVLKGVEEAFRAARKLAIDFEEGKLDPHLVRGV